MAHKHKKRSAKWAYQTYTKELRIEREDISVSYKFDIPKSDGISKFKGKNIFSMLPQIQGSPIPITLGAICSASELDCAIPNCPNKAAEWHHIKHRKRIKGVDNRKKISSYTAKQIPLCLKHHVQVHGGKYDGPSLRKLSGYTPSDFN